MKPNVAPQDPDYALAMIADGPLCDDTPVPERSLRIVPGATSASIELPANKSVLLTRAYVEFCDRLERGEAVDPDAYCAQFPSMRIALARLLQAHQFVEEKAGLLPPLPPARFPEAGETFVDFNFKMELGRGSFARVLLATEPKLGNRLVALKIAMHGSAEADVLGRMQHPNIVPVHSVQDDKKTGLTAVCMPYVGGATLCEVLDRAFAPGSPRPVSARVIIEAAADLPFPLDASHPGSADPVLENGAYVDGVRWIGACLADALAFIHERNIYHRDLKPSNVLLTPQGVPMLLDFNLCNDITDAQQKLGGTFQYMSPEQLAAVGSKDPSASLKLDARSDIFSLGVILYLLATGEHPFGPTSLKVSAAELRRQLLERHKRLPVEARHINPDVDATLSRVIERCLAYDPKDRPQTAGEIAQLLRPQAAPRRQRWVDRHPRKVAAAALLVVALGLAGLSYAAFGPHPQRETPADVGMRLYQQGRYEDAIAQLNEALQVDPANHDARLARAHARLLLGAVDKENYGAALEDYREADKRRPEGRNKAALGYCLNHIDGSTQVAVHHYQQAIESGFATAAVYNNLGFSYLKLGDDEHARENLNKAIELDPKQQAAFHNRALVAFRIVHKDTPALGPNSKDKVVHRILNDGIADCEKALALGPPTAELHFDAARLYALAARIDHAFAERAIEHATKAVAQGEDPKKLNTIVFAKLREEAPFRALTARPGTGQPIPPTRRIVNPISDAQ